MVRHTVAWGKWRVTTTGDPLGGYSNFNGIGYKRSYLGEEDYLPPEVQAWLGVEENDPVVFYWNEDDDTSKWDEKDWQVHRDRLSCLNDEGFSFSEIAKFIRRTYNLG